MQWLTQAQSWIMLALAVGAIGCGVYAFVDAARHTTGAFAAEGKQSKVFWLVALGVSVAVLFVTLPDVLTLFGLIAIIAIGVYLADVRPALAPHRARRARGRGASGSGPHGSW